MPVHAKIAHTAGFRALLVASFQATRDFVARFVLQQTQIRSQIRDREDTWFHSAQTRSLNPSRKEVMGFDMCPSRRGRGSPRGCKSSPIRSSLHCPSAPQPRHPLTSLAVRPRSPAPRVNETLQRRDHELSLPLFLFHSRLE